MRAENAGRSSGRWCWSTTATASTARGSARAATPCRRSSSRSRSRSGSARPTSSCSSRRAPQWNRLVEDKFWRQVQLRAADRQRPAAPRRPAAGSPAARGVASFPSTSSSTTTRGATTSTPSSSRARSTWPSRASAWPFPRPSSSGSRAPIPSAYELPAQRRHQAQRQGHQPGPRSSSKLPLVPEEAVAGGDQADARRAGSSTSSTRSPTRTSST